MANENRAQKRAEARRDQKLQKEQDNENSRQARRPRTKELKKPASTRKPAESIRKKYTNTLEWVREHTSSFLHQFVSFWTWLWNYSQKTTWRAPDLLLFVCLLLSYFTFDSKCGNESTGGTLKTDQEGVHQDAKNDDRQNETDADVSSKGTPGAELESTVESRTPESDHVELDELEPKSNLEALREHFTGLASITETVNSDCLQVEDAARVYLDPDEAASTSESDHMELEELQAETRLEDSTQEIASTTKLVSRQVGEVGNLAEQQRDTKTHTSTTTARKSKPARKLRVIPALPDLDRLFPGRRRGHDCKKLTNEPNSAAVVSNMAPRVLTALPDLDSFFGPGTGRWADDEEPVVGSVAAESAEAWASGELDPESVFS